MPTWSIEIPGINGVRPSAPQVSSFIQVTHLYCLYVTHPSLYCASIVSVRTDGASIVADWAFCTGVLQSESKHW